MITFKLLKDKCNYGFRSNRDIKAIRSNIRDLIRTIREANADVDAILYVNEKRDAYTLAYKISDHELCWYQGFDTEWILKLRNESWLKCPVVYQ